MIQNLDHLIHLRELNLAENAISKIENLKNLVNLEKLNLNGNHIKQLTSELHFNEKLNTLKVSRNKIADPLELQKLQPLQSLRVLSICDNPLTRSISYIEYAVSLLPSLSCIDNKKISQEKVQVVQQLFGSKKKNVVK